MTDKDWFLENVLRENSTHIEFAVSAGKLVDSKKIIARYTAAIAVNFTNWIGMTIPWVRHELAYQALVDNMRCEASEDHIGMLYDFAGQCGAMPDREDYLYVEEKVANIRDLFKELVWAGIRGLSLLTTLEHTSKIFIPDLARRGKECGCTDFTYTDKHGEADAVHSVAFIKAVEAEMTMDYRIVRPLVHVGSRAAADLIYQIYLE